MTEDVLFIHSFVIGNHSIHDLSVFAACQSKHVFTGFVVSLLTFGSQEVFVKREADLNARYVPSKDIVAREIEGELIIVPLVSGIGDMEDELYTLNKTGRAIWDRLNGRASLKDVVEELSGEFDDPESEIEKDVIGLISELLKRGIVVQASEG